MNLSELRTGDLVQGIKDRFLVAARCVREADAHPLASSERHGLRDVAAEIGRRALLARGDVGRSSAESPARCVQAALGTDDFGLVLADTIKILVVRALEENLAHRGLAQTVEVKDFRPANLGSVLPVEVSESSQSESLSHVTLLVSEGSTISIKRFGKLISITPEVIINDDEQIVINLLLKVGSSIARAEASSLFGELASNPQLPDGEPVFSSNLGNALTAADPFGIAGVATGVAALRLQAAAPQSDALNLSPRYVLVAPENEVTLRTSLFQAQLTQQIAVVAHSKIPPSDALWLAGPAESAVLALGFLRGVKKPMVDRSTRFSTGATRFRIQHFFGVGLLGRIGAVRVRKI